MRAVTRSLIGAVALASAGMLAPTAAWALADNAPESHVHDHHMTSETMHSNAPESHAHEHHMMSGTKRSTVDYTLPAVMLLRDDGQTVALKNELDDGRPVVLTFIYTTCTTICPLISQTLSQLQSELGADRDKVHLVSISIDPEEDTPARLREYAKKFGAGPQWQHYTGTVAASIAAQRAFDVYRGDKMSHNPVTLFRAAPGKPWLRIDGFVTAAELLSAYHDLAASK